jgi:hypothetical protein
LLRCGLGHAQVAGAIVTGSGPHGAHGEGVPLLLHPEGRQGYLQAVQNVRSALASAERILALAASRIEEDARKRREKAGYVGRTDG